MIASWTTDMWSPIINLFSFIPSYGFMIIVFTICLKIILSPLDFWQKKVSRASMVKQQKLQPELEKIKKRYGNNQQMVNQKTMELYKRENYNVIGSCFSMILNLALTLFIFFTLFTGLIGISQDRTYNQYLEVQNAYYETFNTEMRAEYGLTAQENNADITAKLNELIDAKKTEARDKLIEDGTDEPDEATILAKAREMLFAETEGEFASIVSKSQTSASEKYEEIKDNWLWVKNIWRPDTYVAGYPNFNDFSNMTNLKARLNDNQAQFTEIEQNFNIITSKIQQNYSSWNGYFILVLLAGVVTYFSMVISQMISSKKSPKMNVNRPLQQGNGRREANPASQMNGATKIMKIIMPIIMIIFTISYSATFAMYIVTNSLMSLIISFISLKILEKLDKKKIEKENQKKKVEYSR